MAEPGSVTGLLLAWGKGDEEAFQQLVPLVERELHRIEILVAVDNLGSQKVAERAGAVREGILRQRLNSPDRRHDCILFSILKTEFET